MPKKTKKDKILSEKRRQKEAEKLISYSFVKPQPEAAENRATNGSSNSERTKEIADTKPQTDINESDRKLLIRDLTKILAFTIFALGAQGVLYFFLRG